MPVKKIGKQSWQLASLPKVISWASVVGPMEGRGPLGSYFDLVMENDLFAGDSSWEKTEQKMMQHSMEMALEKKKLQAGDLDFYLAGDLLNQITNASLTARFFGVPFLGLYGACSTMLEGMSLAGMLVDGGFADRVGVSASSHHSTAERQLRFPTEMGVQRPMTAQWTVTGAGSCIVGQEKSGISMTHVTVGKIIDMGLANANDMGTAMAPAAQDTIIAHLQDLGRGVNDYDLIVTGDLGTLGLEVLRQLMRQEGYPTDNITDCGALIYREEQDTHAGGSGCGCVSVVSNYLLQRMLHKDLQRVLLLGTGALMSPTTSWQGETIPCIAHGVSLEYFE
jgi:stage V sporulation protein AD